MTAVLIVGSLVVGVVAGGSGARWFERRHRGGRERALSVQVRALEAAIDVTRDAWMAKAAMHEQARQIRRGYP